MKILVKFFQITINYYGKKTEHTSAKDEELTGRRIDKRSELNLTDDDRKFRIVEEDFFSKKFSITQLLINKIVVIRDTQSPNGFCIANALRGGSGVRWYPNGRIQYRPHGYDSDLYVRKKNRTPQGEPTR